MAHDTSTAHIPPEELADYFAARVSASREEAIERHLGGCDACAEEARQLRTFSAIWEEWTTQAPDEAWEQVALTAALQEVQRQEDNPAWRERLARWQTQWQGKSAAAVRLVVEAADQTVRVVTEGLEALTTPGHPWGFALASALESTRCHGEYRDVSQGAVEPEPASPQMAIRVGQASSEAQGAFSADFRGQKMTYTFPHTVAEVMGT